MYFLLILILLLVLVSHEIRAATLSEKFESVRGEPTIPRILIQTWKSQTLANPEHRRCQQRLLQLHPDYQYLYFDDEQVDAFMKKHFPQYNTFFTEKLRSRIQQIDFFRLCAVYHFGGVYYDLDMYPLVSLDDLVSSTTTLVMPVEHYLTENKCRHYQSFHRYRHFQCQDVVTLGNYALAAPPRNRELGYLIERIVHDYDEIDPTKVHRLVYVYTTTGPDKVTEVYYTNEEFRKNVVLLHSNEKTAHFGKYASHLAVGTWK